MLTVKSPKALSKRDLRSYLISSFMLVLISNRTSHRYVPMRCEYHISGPMFFRPRFWAELYQNDQLKEHSSKNI